MEIQDIAIEIHNVWIALVAIAFFDCLFILSIALTAAWSVSFVNSAMVERERVRDEAQDERYKKALAEFQLMAQMVKRIIEHDIDKQT